MIALCSGNLDLLAEENRNSSWSRQFRSQTEYDWERGMKIFIISDLHANLEALSALPRDHDELWVL